MPHAADSTDKKGSPLRACLFHFARARRDAQGVKKRRRFQRNILDSAGFLLYIYSKLGAMLKKLQKPGSKAGFKRTPQRLAILEYLEGNLSHPSAEDIYRAVSRKYHSMSFATVYNTLNTLAKGGAVRELTIDPERRRYDPDTSRHHHLICVDCKKVVDIAGDLAVEIPKTMAKDFTVFGNHVEFYGHCAPCGKKKKKKP
jgi:Fur family peroxide stress response transcriptional regulator